jgi:hypothetical protein
MANHSHGRFTRKAGILISRAYTLFMYVYVFRLQFNNIVYSILSYLQYK